jgi:hypothetical protein
MTSRAWAWHNIRMDAATLTTLFTTIGTVGVSIILLAFFLLQTGRLNAGHMRYQLLNIAGSALMLVSLSHQWNTPSVIIQCCWIAISLYGIYRIKKGSTHAEK